MASWCVCDYRTFPEHFHIPSDWSRWMGGDHQLLQILEVGLGLNAAFEPKITIVLPPLRSPNISEPLFSRQQRHDNVLRVQSRSFDPRAPLSFWREITPPN